MNINVQINTYHKYEKIRNMKEKYSISYFQGQHVLLIKQKFGADILIFLDAFSLRPG